jgi:hypothetical protein
VSSSDPKAQLRVIDGAPTLEIEVADSNFSPVASGVGGLEAELEPGLYEISFREGTSERTQLLKVGPGEERTVTAPELAPVSPAPIVGEGATADQAEPVIAATSTIQDACAAPGPESGGLLVMIRNVSGQDELALPEDLPHGFSIVGADRAPVDSEGERWQHDEGAGWALWSAALVPGGYALSYPDATADRLYQAFWVDEGWQMLVFIPNTPQGPAPGLASIHITRVGEWSPWTEGSTLAVALESVLSGLRSGRSVVPADLDQLFDAKFSNPFLGIAAGHALILDPERSISLLETVLGNLRRLIPESPDLAALNYRARNVGAEVEVSEGVSWPPSFYTGYRALLRADAASPGVIADGSPAERVAAQLRISGLWTTWSAGGETDLAAERIRSYAEGAAEVENTSADEILSERSIEQLAKATGLPSATAERAVSKVRQEEV